MKRFLIASLIVVGILVAIYAALPKFAGIPAPVLRWIDASGERYKWRGSRNPVSIDPAQRPGHVFRISRGAGDHAG